MATVAPEHAQARPGSERRRRRAGGLLLPGVAVACLLLTVVVALAVASRVGPAESAVAATTAGPAAVVASSSSRAKPSVAKPGATAGSSSMNVPASAVRPGVSPSPDRLAPGSPERAAAEFAAAWASGAPPKGASAASPTDLGSLLGGLKLLGAEIGAARLRGADRADVPMQVTYEGAAGASTAAVEAVLNRDGPSGWQVDAAALARDLGVTGSGGTGTSVGQAGGAAGGSLAPGPARPADSAPSQAGGAGSNGTAAQATSAGSAATDAASAALAALGQAMRSSGAATSGAAETTYPSGGLGLAEAHWAQHGRRDTSGVRGWFGLQYREGNISRIEKTMAAGSGLSLEDARREARALAPDDAVPAGRATAAEAIDLYTSQTLAARFRDLQTKPGEPARFHARYRVSGERVVSYTLTLGAP